MAKPSGAGASESDARRTYTLYGGAAHGGGGVGAVARGCRGRCGPLRWRVGGGVADSVAYFFASYLVHARLGAVWSMYISPRAGMCVRTSSVRTDCGLCSDCGHAYKIHICGGQEKHGSFLVSSFDNKVRATRGKKIRKSKNMPLLQQAREIGPYI